MTRERERKAGRYAWHLALRVRGSKGAFKLVTRYGEERVIGTYKSIETLERGIKRYHERELVRMEAEG
jgi:hypothetical protein